MKPRPGNTCAHCAAQLPTVTEHMVHVTLEHAGQPAPPRNGWCPACATEVTRTQTACTCGRPLEHPNA